MNPKRFEGHTPGPWVREDNWICQVAGRTILRDVDIGTDVIPFTDTEIANLNLVAASPQLLQENRELLKELKEHHEGWVFECSGGNREEAMRDHKVMDPDCPTCCLIARVEEAEYEGD